MSTSASVPEEILAKRITALGEAARRASFQLAALSTEEKNTFLHSLADALEENLERIRRENARDLEAAETRGIRGALLDRLTLTPQRIALMAQGVRQVAALPDPVGEEIERIQPPNGLDIRKVRTPIGVVAIIYESRPNVTVDCAVLCLKSGNASILRGGSEAFHSNSCLAAIISECLTRQGLNPDFVQLVPTTDRGALDTLLKLDRYIHCIIPRGGEALIRFVAENSTVPVIKHYKGVCNVYVHADANLEQACRILLNAKCQRPSVCNAAENCFIHRDIAAEFLPLAGRALHAEGVELRVDGDELARILSDAGVPSHPASEEDFFEEYLDKILSIRLVDSLDQAIDAVNTYGSGHSDAILATDPEVAQAFLDRVDAATVYWNASTRFTDGFQFGMGAEIGISTDRLHARGPMGLRELCTYKYMIYGKGEII